MLLMLIARNSAIAGRQQLGPNERGREFASVEGWSARARARGPSSRSIVVARWQERRRTATKETPGEAVL